MDVVANRFYNGDWSKAQGVNIFKFKYLSDFINNENKEKAIQMKKQRTRR